MGDHADAPVAGPVKRAGLRCAGSAPAHHGREGVDPGADSRDERCIGLLLVSDRRSRTPADAACSGHTGFSRTWTDISSFAVGNGLVLGCKSLGEPRRDGALGLQVGDLPEGTLGGLPPRPADVDRCQQLGTTGRPDRFSGQGQKQANYAYFGSKDALFACGTRSSG